MTMPLIILAIGSIFSGLIFANIFIGDDQNIFWNNSIVLQNIEFHTFPFIQSLIIKLAIATGIVLAVIIYYYNKGLGKNFIKYFNPLYLISLNKFYFDEFYDKIFTRPIFYLGSFFWKKGDQKSIDAYGPDGISFLIKKLSNYTSKLQSGYLYHYVFVMLGGLVIILSWFFYN